MSTPSRFVDWLIPHELRNAEAETRRRARIVVGITLALIFWAPVFGIIYEALGLRSLSIGVLVAGAIGALVLLFFRRAGLLITANLVTFVLTAIVTFITTQSGGISSPGVAWFVAVPMAATMMAGYRYGTVWLTVTLLVLIAEFLRVPPEWSVIPQLERRQIAIWAFSAMIGITLVVYSLTLIYEKLKDHALSTVMAADRAKSEFLANMSHELRTPLTAILGFADLLLEEGQALSPAERASRLQTVRRNGQHLLELINGILDLSKIEAGKMQVTRQVVSPSRILRDVIALLEVRADAKNLSLRMGIEGLYPQTVLTDPTSLRQILINLVGNAIKFTEQGSVSVRTRFVARESGESTLQFDVIDTGIGLSPEQAARLFEPFTQVDASATRNYAGTGLGLAISRRLARTLGGDVTLTSTRGAGSLFRLEIAAPQPTTMMSGASLADSAIVAKNDVKKCADSPRSDVPARDTAPLERPSNPALAGMRILLAEDGPDNRQLLAFVLRRAGAEVAFAENGRIAVECALAARHCGRTFDAILMDMQMPVLDGYSATRELREAGCDLPIIALTAHAMADDREKCLAAGCNDYTTKPIDRAELLAIIAKYWNGECVTTGCAESSPQTPA